MVIGLSGVCNHTSDEQNRTPASRSSDLLITSMMICYQLIINIKISEKPKVFIGKKF